MTTVPADELDQPEFKIDDLVVRPWRSADADAVYAACQDPIVQRWTQVPRPYDMTHAVGFVGEFSASGWANRTSASFGVFDADTDDLLGSMGLVKLDLAANEAELGYWTAAAARGRGVATRAGRAVAQWATSHLGIDRLVWRAEIGNHASRLVALRIGFTMEGVGHGDLRAPDGMGRRDGWTAALRPGEVISATPPALAAGSLVARRAAAFGQAQPDLSTGLGTLRPHADDDIPHIVEACRDPQTAQWTPVAENYQIANAERFVHVVGRDIWARGDGGVFAITGADGDYCGSIDFVISADDPAAGEIGFHVAPWARGRGLGPAAVRTLCSWAFDSLGLARIVWRAHVGNHASRRVAEKAGFTMEGIQRAGVDQRGSRRDAWVAALLATDPR